MKRFLTWLFTIVVCLPAMLVVAALFAINNPTASAWLLQRASAHVPGALVLEDIRGDLVTGISFGSISYAAPAFRIEARNVTVGVDWLWLIESRLYIERLTAGHFVLTVADEEDQRRGEALPTIDLPLAISLNELQLNRFEISTPGFGELLTDIRGRARFSDSLIDVASLTAQRGALAVNIVGAIRLSGAYPLNARIDWRSTVRPISGSGSLRGDLTTLAFDHRLNIPDEIGLTGVLHSIINDPTFDVTANWDQIIIPNGADDPVTLAAGQASVRGNATQFRLELGANVAVSSLPPFAASVAAAGNLNQLEISRLSITGFDGQIDGTGHADISERILSLQLEGRNLNPATVIDGLSGRLDTHTRITARSPDRFEIDIEQVAGILLEQKLSGHAMLNFSGEQISITGLQLAAGTNRVSFDGDVLPRLAGRIGVAAEDLSELLPELRGQITGSGEIGGTLVQPVGKIDLRGTELFYRNQGAAQLLVKGRIDADQRIDASISARTIRSGDTMIGDLTTTATGTLAAQTIDLSLSGGVINIDIDAAGGWDGRVLQYRLNTAEVDPGLAGAWRLRSYFDAQMIDSMIQLTAHCWEQAAAELCIGDSTLGKDELILDGHVHKLPLATFQRWLTEGFNVSGTANVDFNLRRRDGGFDGHLRWTQEDTLIGFNDSEDTMIETGIDELSLEITGTDQRADLTGSLLSNLGIAIDLDASLTNLLANSPGINGRLRILAADVGESAVLINRFFEVQKLEGRLNADLRVTGSLAIPRISGTGGIIDGAAYLPQTGIALENLRFAVNGRNDAPVSLTASATSGGGTLTIDGTLDVSEQTGPFANLRIRGDNFQVMRLPNQTVHVSPDLNSRIDEGRIDISGTVLVPNAEFLVDTLPESAAVPSADVVIETAGETKRARRKPIEYVGEIELQLGENVYFSGFGIQTRLAGGLKLSRAAGAVDAFAEGNLRTVDGRFEAYRRKLNIDRGTLIFAGPLSDPNVDARTSREIDYAGQTITVGVLLAGPLSNLRTKLFSEPAMSEADALSYLVLNRPFSLGANGEADDLSAAAIAFGISQALPMTEEFQDILGIDEVSLEGATTETTAIAAGKRLSSDMDIRYSYGLFNRIGTFIIRYDLKRGFVIEAGSGEEQTLDLIYTIKR